MKLILCLSTLIHIVLTCPKGKKTLSAGDITELKAHWLTNGLLHFTWHAEDFNMNQKKIFKVKKSPPADVWISLTEFYTFDGIDPYTMYTIEVQSIDTWGQTFGSGQNISIRLMD
uniref:Fibronectin type-III domain-containing protein n=1 Tax=Schistocephalus solidus TaxID=70667 RepID=A0A0X3Q550_SCHSO